MEDPQSRICQSLRIYGPEEAKEAVERYARLAAMIDDAPHVCPDFRLPDYCGIANIA